MKSGQIVSVIAVALSLAAGCSSTSDSTGAGGRSGTGGAANPADGAAGTTGGSAGAGGSTADIKLPKETEDCSDLPCAAPLACCPADNTCTVNDFKICPSTVMVQCTRASDCPTGKVCCVTAKSLVGSGPSGSVCADSCTGAPDDSGVGMYQGIACNNCPAPASQWDSCWSVPNCPAGLGLCTKP
jgi:hypothetical protein